MLVEQRLELQLYILQTDSASEQKKTKNISKSKQHFLEHITLDLLTLWKNSS